MLTPTTVPLTISFSYGFCLARFQVFKSELLYIPFFWDVMMCHEVSNVMMCHEASNVMMCHEVSNVMICHEASNVMMCHEVSNVIMCHEVSNVMMCHEVSYVMMCHAVHNMMMCHVVHNVMMCHAVRNVPCSDGNTFLKMSQTTHTTFQEASRIFRIARSCHMHWFSVAQYPLCALFQ